MQNSGMKPHSFIIIIKQEKLLLKGVICVLCMVVQYPLISKKVSKNNAENHVVFSPVSFLLIALQLILETDLVAIATVSKSSSCWLILALDMFYSEKRIGCVKEVIVSDGAVVSAGARF